MMVHSQAIGQSTLPRTSAKHVKHFTDSIDLGVVPCPTLSEKIAHSTVYLHVSDC